MNEQIATSVGEVKSQQMFLLEEFEEFLLQKDKTTSKSNHLQRSSTRMNMFAPTLEKMDERMTFMEQMLCKMMGMMEQQHSRKTEAKPVTISDQGTDTNRPKSNYNLYRNIVTVNSNSTSIDDVHTDGISFDKIM